MPRFKNILSVSIFVFLVLLTCAASYVWLARDNTPPYGITPPLQSMRFYLAWQDHGFRFSDFAAVFEPQYPPLTHLLYTGYFLIWGLHTGKEMLVNTLFLVIALIALYGLARALYGELVAVAAVALFLSFPGTLAYSRRGFTEFAVMGMVTLSIWLLVRTEYFSRRAYAVLFGLALGLTALTKWSFLPFVAGPLLVVSGYGCLRKDPSRAKRYFLLSILIALALSLPWYIPHMRDAWMRFHIDKLDASPRDFLFTKANLAAFLHNCRSYFRESIAVPSVKAHMDLNYLLIFLCAGSWRLAYRCFHRAGRAAVSPGALVLFLWISVPFVTLCLPVFTGIRHPSHLLAVLPACALALSVTLLRIRPASARILFLCATAAVALPYWYINLCAPFLRQPAQKSLPLQIETSFSLRHPLSSRLRLARVLLTDLQRVSLLPSQENWRHKDILDFIVEDRAKDARKEKPAVLLVGTSQLFRYRQFEYCNLRMHDKVMLVDAFHTRLEFYANLAALHDAIFDSPFDYIVVRDGVRLNPLTREAFAQQATLAVLERRQEEFRRLYVAAMQFGLPDGSRAIVYRRL
ncbi:MAG TPA: glycosyltransferase family 39 protein [Patescibacteria group bacterium]|nr:glycosyltransferase family 39 protein [Patescibacteria group bacterium]